MNKSQYILYLTISILIITNTFIVSNSNKSNGNLYHLMKAADHYDESALDLHEQALIQKFPNRYTLDMEAVRLYKNKLFPFSDKFPIKSEHRKNFITIADDAFEQLVENFSHFDEEKSDTTHLVNLIELAFETNKEVKLLSVSKELIEKINKFYKEKIIKADSKDLDGNLYQYYYMLKPLHVLYNEISKYFNNYDYIDSIYIDMQAIFVTNIDYIVKLVKKNKDMIENNKNKHTVKFLTLKNSHYENYLYNIKNLNQLSQDEIDDIYKLVITLNLALSELIHTNVKEEDSFSIKRTEYKKALDSFNKTLAIINAITFDEEYKKKQLDLANGKINEISIKLVDVLHKEALKDCDKAETLTPVEYLMCNDDLIYALNLKIDNKEKNDEMSNFLINNNMKVEEYYNKEAGKLGKDSVEDILQKIGFYNMIFDTVLTDLNSTLVKDGIDAIFAKAQNYFYKVDEYMNYLTTKEVSEDDSVTSIDTFLTDLEKYTSLAEKYKYVHKGADKMFYIDTYQEYLGVLNTVISESKREKSDKERELAMLEERKYAFYERLELEKLEK